MYSGKFKKLCLEILINLKNLAMEIFRKFDENWLKIIENTVNYNVMYNVRKCQNHGTAKG